MITDYQWIDDNSELEQLLLSINTKDNIAFDSEFERINTFFPKPALFQLNSGNSLYLIDMKKITDTSIFEKLLDNIVLHSGSEDLEILFNLNKKLPATVFDTQVAASLCGYGLHFSYQNIVHELLGIELSKAHSRSDWMKRPLSSAQIQYALEDVLYLPELHNILSSKLQKLGRMPWYELLIMQKSNGLINSDHVQKTFVKIAKSKGFDESQQKLLYSLLDWREKMAIKRDKPRGWILKNHEIIDIVLQQPQNDSQLIKDIGLYHKFVKHNASAIIDLYKSSQEIELKYQHKFEKLTPQQGVLLTEAKQKLAQKCEQLNIPSAVIVNIADLKSLIAAGKNLHNIDMWQLITNQV